MSAEPRVKSASIDLKVGETLTLRAAGVDSGEIRLTLLRKTGQLARLEVRAPEMVKIGMPAKRSGT